MKKDNTTTTAATGNRKNFYKASASLRALCKLYYDEQKEKRNTYSSEYYAKNRIRILERKKLLSLAKKFGATITFPESTRLPLSEDEKKARNRARVKAWRDKNPDKVKQYKAKNSAKQKIRREAAKLGLMVVPIKKA